MSEIETIINSVLPEYNLGKRFTYRAISRGFANENYKIVSDKGNFLFRICKEQSLAMINYEMRLMESLRKIDFPTAFPIKRTDGEYISTLHDKNIVLYEFKSGKEPLLNSQVASEVAIAIGKLTHLPDKEKLKKLNVINLPDCLKMIGNFSKAEYQYPDIFRDFEKIILFLQEALKAELPQGVIHADLFPDNTLFEGNKLVAIIDFEEANYDKLLFDVGMTINGFCFHENKLDNNLYKAFMISYNKVRKLTTLENELIVYYIIWGAIGMSYWHLRHLISRPFKIQQNRVEELIRRAQILMKSIQPEKLYT